MTFLVYVVTQNQVISRPGYRSADFYFDAESYEAAAFVAYHQSKQRPKALCVIDEATRKFRVYRTSKGSVFEDAANTFRIWVKQLEPKRLRC